MIVNTSTFAWQSSLISAAHSSWAPPPLSLSKATVLTRRRGVQFGDLHMAWQRIVAWLGVLCMMVTHSRLSDAAGAGVPQSHDAYASPSKRVFARGCACVRAQVFGFLIYAPSPTTHTVPFFNLAEVADLYKPEHDRWGAEKALVDSRTRNGNGTIIFVRKFSRGEACHLTNVPMS